MIIIAGVLSAFSVAECQYLSSRWEEGTRPSRYALQLVLLSAQSGVPVVANPTLGFSPAWVDTSDASNVPSADSASQGRRCVPLAIAGEIVLGGFMGSAFSVPCGYAAVQISGAKGFEGMAVGIVGMYAGYVVGSSLGVYAGGDGQSRHISELGTIGSGLIGGAVSVLIFAASDQKGIPTVLPLVLPLVVSIIYVEVFN